MAATLLSMLLFRRYAPFAVWLAVLLLSVSPVRAQDHSTNRSSRAPAPRRQVSAAIYGQGGFNYNTVPAQSGPGLLVQVGGYVDFSRFALQPGVDARVYGNLGPSSVYFGGTGDAKLIGPRLSFRKGIARPYVEGLFGTGHQDDVEITPLADGRFRTTVSGNRRVVVAGLDLLADTHVEVRVFEYSFGHLGPSPGTASSPGLREQTFTSGLVFRFP